MPRRYFPSRQERENVIPLPKHRDRFIPTYDAAGVSLAPFSRRVSWVNEPFNHFACAELAAFLSQLEEQRLADIAFNGTIAITWQNVYNIQKSTDYGASYPLLPLPPLGRFKPCLASRGSFSDPDFSIFVAGWIGQDGLPLREDPEINGAVITAGHHTALLVYEAWETLQSVAAFHQRELGQRTGETNLACWSKIRLHAHAAHAALSHFLQSTVVVTPETLKIGLRKNDIGEAKVVEVIPDFADQPRGWLQTFDRLRQVQERYEIADGERLTHVVITPEMQTVLREIKRMPGRRVSGERAEAFLRNPFASLGPDAQQVIDPVQFEEARTRAGITFTSFKTELRCEGAEFSVALLIDDGGTHGSCVTALPFSSPDDLTKFIVKLKDRIGHQAQCCPWRGYQLEILGDAPHQLELLGGALQKWKDRLEYACSEIFDLSRYSVRVEGIGVEKFHYVPFITRKTDLASWFPENVTFGLRYPDGEPGTQIAKTLSEENIKQLEGALQQAKQNHQTEVLLPWLPKPIPLRQAEAIMATFTESNAEIGEGSFDPETSINSSAAKRSGLIIKLNDEKVSYSEVSGDLTPRAALKPLLPQLLRKDVQLLNHQLSGVAWLQHLWKSSPFACRGALLADDMGLGKTLQLLTFIASCLEQNPALDPCLIVAPVALLENWKQEIEKYFMPGALSVLTLYGRDLVEKRLPRPAIQEELLSAGIARLLTRDWRGNANVVLTTYETLRDLEFSLAGQRWSVMVCDEAQKIKTPNTLVSRAARKQNARFKIACTGTPVENTLADLWCLFDFVQPGLLGSLRDFGDKYRKPIEAETDAEKARLDELRALIAPQTLRRTKAEVSKDLPRKIVDEGCRSLQVSEIQRAYYCDALAIRRGRRPSNGPTSHLALLLYLRRVCSDPVPFGTCLSGPFPLAELEASSPKMRWLLAALTEPRSRGEKVIIFCEIRELQRTIQRAIHERLGKIAPVINGDAFAAGQRADARQRRLDLFQQQPGFGVIILSPLVVGFGVNIQAANHVIHFTRAWNPAREDQATDRAYRIGQTKDVWVYHPLVIAEDFVTFDEKLDRLLDGKRKLSQDMLNGCAGLAESDFSDIHTRVGSPISANAIDASKKQDLA